MFKNKKAVYAIPCFSWKPNTYDINDLYFFVTFNTDDPDEALRLASCVCGLKKAKLSLVRIEPNGTVTHVFENDSPV